MIQTGVNAGSNSSSIMRGHVRRHNLIHKPVVFGTYAIFRGKKVPQDELYAWCCYARGKDDEDISRFVTKVEFELDPSFPEPVVTVTRPPFEMHQVGWGQFPIKITLFFADPVCKPVETVKDLVLFDDMNPTTKRPIVTEDYNELVFIDPSPMMLKLLATNTPVNAQGESSFPPHDAAVQENGTTGDAAKEDVKMDDAQGENGEEN